MSPTAEAKICVELVILRQKSPEDSPHWQSVSYETQDLNATVASALTEINEGVCAENPVRWLCSCLQKKCGACAMLINDAPRLACDAKLKECMKKGRIRLAPLRKFPIVADLMVDRSVMQENLKTLELWAESNAALDEAHTQAAYDASRCLQCGCCLEVCPNFCAESEFFGAAGFTPLTRLLNSLADQDLQRVRGMYRRHIYSGCGKSLACEKVCPAGIDMEKLLLHSNALAWAHRKKKREE